ncbi:hypothetical protein V5O48_001587 [Marasmius crinis-equi]|uniref:Uncharacterized protein n=1 Tax=Marasmius crinis-equi TaxID=585013 RepID=A0ABR3FYE6_9AGAR
MKLSLLLLLLSNILLALCKNGDGGGDDDDNKGPGNGQQTTQNTAPPLTTAETVAVPPTTSPTGSPTTGTPTPSSNTTSNSSAGPQDPGLSFSRPDNASTCASTTLFWTPTGGLAKELITLAVTNQGVEGATPYTPLSRTVASNVSADAQFFTWLNVDVPPGWYKAQAQYPNATVVSQSSAFFVSMGTNMSCFTSGTNASHHYPTHKPAHHGISRAELIGIVVGSVAGVAILLMAFAFPHLWRHSLVSSKAQRRHPYRQLF